MNANGYVYSTLCSSMTNGARLQKEEDAATLAKDAAAAARAQADMEKQMAKINAALEKERAVDGRSSTLRHPSFNSCTFTSHCSFEENLF